MNITTLRIFCDVVLSQSFSQGALLNEVSQSAATQAIHRLEEHLSASLIDRSKRPFVLTAEGQTCYESFQKILEIYDNAVVQIKSPQENSRSQLRIAAIYSIGLHEMSRCMQKFMRTFPKAKLRLEYLHPHQIYQAVLNSEIDFGVVSYPMVSQEIDMIPLRSESMLLVCPPDHPLGKLSTVRLELLQNCNFITFDRNLIVRKEIDHFLQWHNINVNTMMEFDNIETIKQAVETGLGISILPVPTVHTEIKQGTLAAIPLVPAAPIRPIGVIHRHRKVFSQNALKFIEILSEESAG